MGGAVMELRELARVARQTQRLRKSAASAGFTFVGDRIWAEDEDALCRRLAPDYTAIAKMLPHRTRGAVKSHCHQLGLQQRNYRWSEQDLKKLRELYKTATPQEIASAFPHRKPVNIRSAANYHGFLRPKRIYKKTGFRIVDRIRDICFEMGWSARDLDEECGSTYFGRAMRAKAPNWAAVRRAATLLGLSRK